MVTAGVASVRSPVCNLQQTSPHVEHDVFMNAVVDEFRREYALDETDDPVCTYSFPAHGPSFPPRLNTSTNPRARSRTFRTV
jgi:hypothetical protein